MALKEQADGLFDEDLEMNKPKQPSKESVRKWLRTELAQRRPPPNPEQIRRELGWELIKIPLERKR